MKEDIKEKFLSQIDVFKKLSQDSGVLEENSYTPDYQLEQLVTMGQEILFKLKGSTFEERAQAVLDDSGYDGYKARMLYGIVSGLEVSIRNDFLENMAELIHGEVFTNFLDMAEHLLEEGYKDASAVMIGTTLETHIKNLAIKNQVDITKKDQRDKIFPKKVNALNADLKAKGVYSQLDHKSITAWMELRNNAAHGNYGEYTRSNVEIMLQGVKDFIRRTPA